MTRGPGRRGGGRHHAVASPHWATSAVGESILDEGGTALDACIAMAAHLSVVYPHMCGAGGDLFLLYYDSRSGDVHGLNGSGRAAGLASREAVARLRLAAMPVRGPLSVTVPGAVAAWGDATTRFGTRPLSELLAPAIKAAEEGYAVTERLANWISDVRDEVWSDPTLRRWFFNGAGQPLSAGSVVRVPELADSLRQIANEGPRAFYEGRIADEIDRACREGGGLLRRSDLEEHCSDWVKPISVTYRGLEVYTTPPNSQGITALAMLNILSLPGTENLRPGSAQYVDALVRAKRVAFADRDRFVSDPGFTNIPVEQLLSQERAAKASSRREPVGANPPTGGDTVYVCSVDREGNACSLIQSIYYAFGAAFVAGDTGILLHNRGHYFSLEESHPNRLEPRKRTLHTLMASMALRNGRPWLVFGTMGADGQPQTTVQVLDQALANPDPQAAVTAPRVLSGRFFVEDDEERLLVEDDFGPEAIAELEAMGHQVRLAPAKSELMGHAHAILAQGGGSVVAGSDPRSDAFQHDQ
jgi:gamma-glutamyltranspeptidase/glutathione hydrolase